MLDSLSTAPAPVGYILVAYHLLCQDASFGYGLDAASLLSIPSMNKPDGQMPINNVKGLTFDLSGCVGTSTSSKLYHIHDFITTMPNRGKEGDAIKVGNVELKLMESKHKLDSVTLLQYMKASLRLHRHVMTFKDGTVPNPPPPPPFSSCQATTPTELNIHKPSLILKVVTQYIAL